MYFSIVDKAKHEKKQKNCSAKIFLYNAKKNMSVIRKNKPQAYENQEMHRQGAASQTLTLPF